MEQCSTLSQPPLSSTPSHSPYHHGIHTPKQLIHTHHHHLKDVSPSSRFALCHRPYSTHHCVSPHRCCALLCHFHGLLRARQALGVQQHRRAAALAGASHCRHGSRRSSVTHTRAHRSHQAEAADAGVCWGCWRGKIQLIGVLIPAVQPVVNASPGHVDSESIFDVCSMSLQIIQASVA